MPVRTGRRVASAAFYQALPTELKKALPAELQRFEHRRQHGVLKVHYGHPETHYEAWYHRAIGRLELGLHFEGARELNARALDFFRERMVEVKGGLPRAELEPWDRGWSRLYETIPMLALDVDALDRAAGTLAAYVTTLQPLLDRFWRSHGPA